jgi:hypothetical protein
MMDCSCIGRFVSTTSLLVLTLGASVVSAQPALTFAERVEGVIESASQSWVQEVVVDVPRFDEKIFTELSPLIEAPAAVKLPEDQQLAD